MSIIDFAGLQYWMATAHRLYMWQEPEGQSPVTQVDLGTLVGQMFDQAPSGIKTSTTSRPNYTNEGAAYAYIDNVATAFVVLRNSAGAFRFFNFDPRIWTIAIKVRFHRASSGVTECIFDSNDITTTNVGINLRKHTDNTLIFFVSDSSGAIVTIVTTDTIADTNWHDVVITSAGSGPGQVSLSIDGGAPATDGYIGQENADMFANIHIARYSVNLGSDSQLDYADMIIMDQVISAPDLVEYRAYSAVPTLDPIAPVSGGWSRLINSEEASIVPALINARTI